jgi:hypothetical protein
MFVKTFAEWRQQRIAWRTSIALSYAVRVAYTLLSLASPSEVANKNKIKYKSRQEINSLHFPSDNAIF